MERAIIVFNVTFSVPSAHVIWPDYPACVKPLYSLAPEWWKLNMEHMFWSSKGNEFPVCPNDEHRVM